VAAPPDNRELEIFNSALELATPAERVAYLDHACGDDAALRAQVDELLRAHEQAEGFLADAPTLVGFDDSGADAPIREGPGTRIGRYKASGLSTWPTRKSRCAVASR
jgi:eukaryotic-like serine/threonine-protein kinase